jgi:hypothetical protein
MRLGVAIGVVVAAASGCIPFIMRGDVVRQADGWTIKLEALKDGPDSVQIAGDTHAVPGQGLRFLWAWVTIRNDVNAPRLLGYDSCSMDLDGQDVLPSIVGKWWGHVEERAETYAPGESIDRRLIFAYPKGRLPTRIKCGNMLFEVPGPRPNHVASR